MLWILSSLAAATPVEIPVAGMLSEAGVDTSGAHTLTFALYADAADTTADLTEDVAVSLVDGVFAARLGVGGGLDHAWFAAHPAPELTVAIDGGAPSNRIPLGTVPLAAFAHAAGTMPASGLTGTVADANLPPSLVRTSGGTFTGGIAGTTGTFSGLLTASSFSGSGASLTSLPASALTGTVADGNLPASLVRTSGGTFTGGIAGTTGTFSGALTASSFSGSGASLTSLPASALTGTVDDGNLPASLVRTSGGTFTGGITGTTGTFTGALTGANLVTAGVVQVGGASAVCNSTTNVGAIRWTGTAFQGCNGSAWGSLAQAAANSQTNPGTSCLGILNAGQSVGDGLYWVAPGGVTPFQVTCDMTAGGVQDASFTGASYAGSSVRPGYEGGTRSSSVFWVGGGDGCCFNSAAGTGQWAQVTFSRSHRLVRMTGDYLFSTGFYGGSFPVHLQGYDGSAWVTVHTFNADVSGGVTFSNPGFYTTYRMLLPSNTSYWHLWPSTGQFKGQIAP
jgi:hypothetical protein